MQKVDCIYNVEPSRHGVCRTTPFSRVPQEDLFITWLATDPAAVISRDSALVLHKLSGVLPAHIAVDLQMAVAANGRP